MRMVITVTLDNQKPSAEEKLDAIAAKEQEIEDVQEVVDVETGEVLS